MQALIEAPEVCRSWARQASRELLALPPVLMPRDLARRRGCEHDLLRFCETYFAEDFWDPCVFHNEFLRELQAGILTRGSMVAKKAIAAPRGIGKTTCVCLAIIWSMLYHHVRFAAIICASGPVAQSRIETIKHHLARNARLAEDFPEIIQWLLSFGPDARRAAAAGGEWSADEIKLNNGCRVMGMGIDGAIRGLLKDNKRPRFILIDDIETDETVRSLTETRNREHTLRRGVCQLHRPGAGASYVMICTVGRRDCIADRFTRPDLEPDWRGQRYRACVEMPGDEKLWERYGVILRTAPGTPAAGEVWAEPTPTREALEIELEAWRRLPAGRRAAMRFYLGHREAMDDGARMLDPQRIPLHEYMSQWHGGDRARETALCELQNDPPEEGRESVLRLQEQHLLERRMGIYPHGLVPPWADVVTVTIDTGLRRHHWEANAISLATGAQVMIHADTQSTGIDEDAAYELADRTVRLSMVDHAVQRGLQRIQERTAEGWTQAGSGKIFLPYYGTDLRGGTERKAWFRAVLEFCRRNGARWVPLRGEPTWRDSRVKRGAGSNWVEGELGEVAFWADEYKTQLSQAYQRPPLLDDQRPFPGSRVLHGPTPEATLQAYCRHQVAEFFDTRRRTWMHDSGRPNHWWDTAVQAQVMLDVLRTVISVEGEQVQEAGPGPEREAVMPEERGMGDPVLW